MIKRISLLVTAALMAAMMMVATAAPAFAGVKSDCDSPSYWDQSTKTCYTPLNDKVTKGTDYDNGGGGGSPDKVNHNPSSNH